MSVAGLKKWAKEERELAMTVATATAFAQVERERVDAYVEPIFARYGFTDEDDGTPITESRRAYLAGDDPRFADYYAECDRAHKEHCPSWDEEPGTCPALVAENLQIQAENLLLDALARFVGVTDKDGHHTFYLRDLRAKALDIALTSALGRLT